MALAEKDAVPAKRFGALRALVDFVDVFNTAMQAVYAELHKIGVARCAIG
jgi:hypothetical protein